MGHSERDYWINNPNRINWYMKLISCSEIILNPFMIAYQTNNYLELKKNRNIYFCYVLTIINSFIFSILYIFCFCLYWILHSLCLTFLVLVLSVSMLLNLAMQSKVSFATWFCFPLVVNMDKRFLLRSTECQTQLVKISMKPK